MRFHTALARLIANVYISVNNELETVMAGVFQAIFLIIDMALNIYWYVIIASAIFSWLYAFNVINSHNQFVNQLGMFFYNATEPALRPIRRFLPNLGGIDISPIILLLIIVFIQAVLNNPIKPFIYSLVA
ncbi:YggT family protein [Rhizobium pisi]|uniref:YggT family protein n=1 Tax=Rhizobium pisi TaxID=574561 RepID=A0A3R9BN98_9HYPH|nr:YggT family protein [Rhizobium pisi]MBB3135276.1 YggT family protein [Rhizobium pisi]RSB78430.1 YggT family protein [Rhizobium pisi]TCA46109.1 YggT family protein [Rhizobium pisi]